MSTKTKITKKRAAPPPRRRSIRLSRDQEKVMGQIERWWADADSRSLTFGGLAGTGKTTVTAMVKDRLGVEAVAYCAPTGKAASVLRQKLTRHGTLGPGDTVETMHRLLYQPHTAHCLSCPVHRSTERKSYPCHAPKGGSRCCATSWARRGPDPTDRRRLVICDEASMVDDALYRDVMALGLPVLFVGDHGQLPPVRGSLSLMADPDVRLEKVHRQAADSPIIQLAMLARESGVIPFGEFGPGVQKVPDSFMNAVEWTEDDADDMDTLTLCYRNSTRVRVNAHIRAALRRPEKRPVPGDRVVCLRNNHDVGIHNGMVGRVLSVKRSAERDDAWLARIDLVDEGRIYEGLISRQQFGKDTTLTGLPRHLDQWDYGYCMTVHKAQGSEASVVFLIEERPGGVVSDDNYKRWLYTGVTRATDELYILRTAG